MNFKSFNLVVSTILLFLYVNADPEMSKFTFGNNGDTGFMGFMGVVGFPGKVGQKETFDKQVEYDVGPKGEKGDQGENGHSGFNGVPGQKGEKGEVHFGYSGPMGPPGLMGIKGERGESVFGPKGVRGDVGDRGPKGEKGSCTCEGLEEGPPSWAAEKEGKPGAVDDVSFSEEDAPAWGTIENPGNTTCKNAPIDETGTYYLYDSIEVVCDVNKKTTCVKINASPYEAFFSEIKPSWLSSAGIEYRDIYNLSNTQLVWLQSRSDTASIKIRYHCVNTKPAHKDAPVLLLSWNDGIIGPHPTPSSPIYYEVENDDCSRADEIWAFTDIVIKNTSAHRLPITDFYIQDNVKDNQHHKITVTELCFHGNFILFSKIFITWNNIEIKIL